MMEWLPVVMALMLWTTLYCLRHFIDDCRARRKKAAISSGFAVLGPLLFLGLGLVVVVVSLYFH